MYADNWSLNQHCAGIFAVQKSFDDAMESIEKVKRTHKGDR
jgi:hypothetical protein